MIWCLSWAAGPWRGVKANPSFTIQVTYVVCGRWYLSLEKISTDDRTDLGKDSKVPLECVKMRRLEISALEN